MSRASESVPKRDEKSKNTRYEESNNKSDKDAPDQPTELSKPSWLGVLRRSVKEFKNDNLTDLAAALTYYGVLAIFPGLLVLVSILGLLGPTTTQEVVGNLGQVAPGGVRTFVEEIINNAQQQQTAAGALAIVGIALALWSASSYIAAFMRASNIIYDVPEGRPIWKTLPIRILVTIAIVVMLLVSALIVVLSGNVASQVGEALGIGQTAVTVWNIVKWPILIIIASFIVSVMYWACPNVKPANFKWVSPGGVLAVLIWIVASGAFAVYAGNFASYNKTYGSVGGVIIFLVWLWISNIALLLGAEFNSELEHARAIEAGLPEDATPFVELRDTRKLDDNQTAEAERTSRTLKDNG